MMSIKTVNALSHYTDWTIGHVHSGALGWVGLI
jgi:cytochrome c oxidase cbb3-type subunit 1